MQLTVLNVVHPGTRVGPEAQEEAGRFLTELDAALNRAGHHSIVIAPEGSVVEGILVEMPAREMPLDSTDEEQLSAQYRAAIETLLTTWRFDVIHLHGFDTVECLPQSDVPVIVTPRSEPGVSVTLSSDGRGDIVMPAAGFVENFVATYQRLAGHARREERPRDEEQQSFAV